MAEMNDHSSRAHALLSASSADRWLKCPPSAVAAELYPKKGTEYTREGTLAHEVAEIYARIRVVEGHRYEEVIPTAVANRREGVDWEMHNCAQNYSDYIQEQIKSDTAVVLLEQRVDFSPWVPGGFGTADCIILQGNTMDVIDYKYGKGVAVSAEDNPQEKLYGLGALNEFGFAYDIEKVRLHIYQPRMNNISVFELDADSLLLWGAVEVKPTAQQAAKGEGEYSPGKHCQFCPHAGRCKALTAVCTEFVKTIEAKIAVPVLAPWEISGILQMEPLVNLWLKRVGEQALTTLLNGGEVPGYKVVQGRSLRRWADDLEAAKILESNGYSREDITKTELLTVSNMEKKLGKKKFEELLGGQVLKPTGAPTLAPESDKRPVYDPSAETLKDLNS